jgi:integrase
VVKRDLPSFITRDRRGTLYFHRRGWKDVRLQTQFPAGDPVPDALYAERARILAGKPEAPVVQTWHHLIASYRLSPRFARLKPRTRADYDKVLTYLAEKLGPLDPTAMTRADLVRMQEANAHRVRFANYCVQVVSVLFEHAIDRGIRPDNPAKGMRLLKADTAAREAWPPEMITAYRAEAGPVARLVFELCLGTGQRIGDVLRMTWARVKDGGIEVVQGKTGARLWVPFTRPLAAVLDATPRRGLTIVADDAGMAYGYHRAAYAVLQVRKRIGAEAYDIHALRHSAARELVEAGCSDELIQAVTGHSTAAMVRLYTGSARQIARAKQAQEKRK